MKYQVAVEKPDARVVCQKPHNCVTAIRNERSILENAIKITNYRPVGVHLSDFFTRNFCTNPVKIIMRIIFKNIYKRPKAFIGS